MSRRKLKIGVAAVAGVLAAAYLSGVFFRLTFAMGPTGTSPLSIVRYAYYYWDDRSVRRRVLWSSAAGGTIVLASGLVLVVPKRRPLHGDARFATRYEVASAGLLGTRGIILGSLGGRCLMLDGQQGVVLAAPPRAGKGTGVVIPNLLNWPDSLICVDIKRENWTLTAGFRSRSGQDCYLFDPFSEDCQTARWNPLFYVSDDPSRRINDLQRIAEMLIPDPSNIDAFWSANARTLFLGIALYLFETPSAPKTIGEVLRQAMATDSEGFGEHWNRLIQGRKSGPHPLSSECVRALCDQMNLHPTTASSIRKTLTSRLDLWLNPILDRATAGNDFDLRELRSRPMSIYVGVNPDDLHRLRPVLALFFQQAIGLQTRKLPEHDPRARHQVLMLLDEFTALGRIPIIAESVSYLPGYNVRVLLVIQTPAQLREVYGSNGAEIMMKSLGARIVFAPKDYSDAKEISDELGNTTIRVRTRSRPQGGLWNARQRTGSVNESEQRRPLLLPQEVKDLGIEEAIIFQEGLRPIRCQKIRYFRDKRFLPRLMPAPLSAMPVDPRAPVTTVSTRSSSTDSAMNSDIVPVALEPETNELTPTREPTIEDIEQIDAIRVEDLDVDLSAVQVPDKERLSDDDLSQLAEQFLASLSRRAA